MSDIFEKEEVEVEEVTENILATGKEKIDISKEEEEVIISFASIDGNKDKNITSLLDNVFNHLQEVEEEKDALLKQLKLIEKAYKTIHEKARKLGVTDRYFQQSSVGKAISTIQGYLECNFFYQHGLDRVGYLNFLKIASLKPSIMRNKVVEYFQSLQKEEEEIVETGNEKEEKSNIEKTCEKFLSYLKSYKKLDSVEKVSFALLVKNEIAKIKQKEEEEKIGVSKKKSK